MAKHKYPNSPAFVLDLDENSTRHKSVFLCDGEVWTEYDAAEILALRDLKYQIEMMSSESAEINFKTLVRDSVELTRNFNRVVNLLGLRDKND